MRARAAALAAVALALVACGAKRRVRRSGDRARAQAGARRRRAAPAARPATLTDAQLAGQHVVFPFAGRTAPRALLARIRRGEAAGVIFLGANLGTPAQVRALTRTLRRVPRPPALRAPLLLMVDQEGGSVQRLPGRALAQRARHGGHRPHRPWPAPRGAPRPPPCARPA